MCVGTLNATPVSMYPVIDTLWTYLPGETIEFKLFETQLKADYDDYDMMLLKSKVVLVQHHADGVWMNGNMVPCYLNFGFRWS